MVLQKVRAARQRKLTIDRPTWLDKWVRPIVMILVNPFTRKDAQGWHWRDYAGPVKDEYTITIAPDETVGDRSKGIIANFRHSDVTARKVVLFRPVEDNVEWHLGFIAVEGGKVVEQVCAAVLKGTAGATVQSYETKFFGLEKGTGRPLQLELVGETTKSELAEDIPLL